MDKYYKDNYDAGVKFERFLLPFLEDHFSEPGIPVLGRHAQIEIGDIIFKKAGACEIKYDKNYEETKNLFIETQEKTRPTDQIWIDSGILKKDHAKWYIIGNYKEIYIYVKEDFQRIYREEDYRIIEIKRGSSRGILIEPKDYEAHIEYGICEKLVLKK